MSEVGRIFYGIMQACQSRDTGSDSEFVSTPELIRIG